MRMLITGSGGFIGGHLADFLWRKGYFVRIADIRWENYRVTPYYSEKITADLRELKNCLEVTKDIDWVFNLAANMGGMGIVGTQGADIMRDNILINMNMLQASHLNKVKRFFFSSSACVYPAYRQGEAEVTELKEEYAIPADPDTYYGWEKLIIEKACEAYTKDYGLETRIARFHNIYGPYGTFEGGREKAPAALCRKIALAKDGDSIEVWGDGEQTRSYCYVSDCVRGIWLLMVRNYDKPINIGTDRLISVNDFVDLIANIASKKIGKTHDLTKPQGVRGRNADLTLAKQILGWTPRISLEEGMEITYNWIKKELQKTGRTVY